jgi:hypothetical protein
MDFWCSLNCLVCLCSIRICSWMAVCVLRARGRVSSEPRKRSALGQARGAQAKPEFIVAKPHLFGSEATWFWFLLLYGVWGEVLPKVLFSDFLSACSLPLFIPLLKPLLKPLLSGVPRLLSVGFHKCFDYQLSVYWLPIVCLLTTNCLFIDYQLSVYWLLNLCYNSHKNGAD